MRRFFKRPSHTTVVAYLALFAAVGTGGAYAANTIGSADIIDNEIRSADVRDDTVSGGGLGSIDIANGEMTTNEIRDDSQPFGGLFAQDLAQGSVGSSEIAGFSIQNQDLATGAVESDVVANNSLTASDLGTGSVGPDEVQNDSLDLFDIKEETLNLPQQRTNATFAFGTAAPTNDAFTKVAAKNVPAGTYAVIAEAEVTTTTSFGGTIVRTSTCEIRANGGFIGGSRDRRVIPTNDTQVASLSMNGIAGFASGGEVSLWCAHQSGGGSTQGQLLIISLDGRFG